MFDLVIRNGTIIDGSGRARFAGDIGISRQRIGVVSPVPGSLVGSEYIDAGGLCVSPGFIDVHSHADRAVLANPYCKSSLLQGITTVFAGQCGGSQGPVNDAMKERAAERARRMGVEPPSVDWHSFGEFLGRVEDAGCGVNLGMFVGQGTVRNYVMGYEDREPSAEELDKMRVAVRDAVKEGAFGLSAGRTYMPGRLAGREEIVAMCREIAPSGGLYACHMLSEGDAIHEAIDELLYVARASGARPHIVHAKVCGKQNWGKAPSVLERIEHARESGLDLMFDVYPYNFAQIGTLRGIFTGVAPRLNIGELLSALRGDPDYAAQVARDAEAEMAKIDPVRLRNLPQRAVVWCQNTREHEWKSFEEIASDLGIGLIPAVIWLGVENHLAVKTALIMSENEVETFIKHPFSMISTDASTQDVPEDKSGAGHPRTFGTYPRVLGRYARDLGALPLEDAVRKMTSVPAGRMGLSDRGLLKEGYFAELVVFDRQTVGETGSVETPSEKPAGIMYVLVNGSVALKDGAVTGEKAGRVLRR